MTKDKSKSTVLIISMGFLLIYIVGNVQLLLYISLAVGILGLSDRMSRFIEKLWMGLAKLLGYIVPNILLTLVFFIVLYPFALIYRLTEDDPLLLSPDHETFWVTDEKEPDPASFEKTW